MIIVDSKVKVHARDVHNKMYSRACSFGKDEIWCMNLLSSGEHVFNYINSIYLFINCSTL